MFLAICLGLVGCAGSPSTPDVIPVTGSPSGKLVIHEYALVEQSTDNPDHAGFAERARQVVLFEREGWGADRVSDRLARENEALAPFGYRADLNPTPPFSGFALYQGDRLVYRDIARFSEISLHADLADFTLPFETISGDWLVASANGLQKISAAPVSDRVVTHAFAGAPLAYASISGSESLNGIGYSGIPDSGETVFDVHFLQNEPFYFVVKKNAGNQVRLNYAGSDLPYVYDRVIHDQTGETAIFNPGGDGHIAWFYALRDGLWYYVEANSHEN